MTTIELLSLDLKKAIEKNHTHQESPELKENEFIPVTNTTDKSKSKARLPKTKQPKLMNKARNEHNKEKGSKYIITSNKYSSLEDNLPNNMTIDQ